MVSTGPAKQSDSYAAIAKVLGQVEDDAEYNARYYNLYRSEVVSGLAQAGRVNLDVLGLGSAGRSMARSADINTPIGTH